ncbi:heterokaryon incompatibility protein-domain-containing protein [Suillus fuscotomentosus]|uniref:Heterokaryon incompatibility protein-domain-containing protein n=1 Tax=Suillus fuscotomentosus TaxID=1912939 RepID=A0AAD4DS26_9AGAM|nr:heterokaryon incompatibility protein-domain-containing protein [Suillus fuscotomentosus]XP_041233437.1 heterokaryon incompatibility protein-domain-containing protein [Suillus fuscotomentosus]KAG1891907.1 heterokaryon incompatibility protein-domain-containing protein [Suillus fuscotomentosus]KAG1907862.1 heterokaryon incompatibility protein-domain-containing protein [Suillus fuscotomentosus]
MFRIPDGQSSVESFYTARGDGEDDLPPGNVSKQQVKQAIQDIADSILRDMPLRLLNTEDGKIYARSALITKFEESNIFRWLLHLTTTRSALEEKQYILKVVKPFFEYTMLSHRWEGDEPGFKDIPQEGVYTLSTSRFDKVRNLCDKARSRGFRWTWIDTCCIDQGSSAEVQKSISSMFSWYRGSALTIIYLSDVVESSSQALLLSEWFRRGWTLQELLAAKVIRLYKKDWTPFSPESNHKNVAEILVALESATGIQKSYLKFYSPSVEHPRMKLRWAQNRVTKEKEDEAYCLMGIFGFTMSVTYGEGDQAFSRLLMEIMRRTGDATLLDWIGQPSTLNTCLPSSPSCFSNAPFATMEMCFDTLPHPVLSFALAAKVVYVFKKAIRRARNSSRVRNGHNTGQELSVEMSDDDGAPHIAKTTSSQSIFLLGRSTSFPFEGSEMIPLARLLEKPPRPYTLNAEIHITVPCFVHEVLSLYFTPVSGSYSCCADGIRPFSLVTSENLEIFTPDRHSSSRYLLARTWDPRLSYDSSHVYHITMPLLRQRLKNQFFAILLERLRDGRFRRVSTGERIVAELERFSPQTYGVRFLHLQ